MFYRNRTNFEIIFYTLQGIFLTKNKQTYVCNRTGFFVCWFHWKFFTGEDCLLWVWLLASSQAFSVNAFRCRIRDERPEKKLPLTTWPETHRPRAIMRPQRGSGVGTLPSFGLNGHVPPNRVWFGGVLNNTSGWAFAVLVFTWCTNNLFWSLVGGRGKKDWPQLFKRWIARPS